MDYLLLVCGFVLLLLSGKYLVRGSVSLANQLKISKLVIGVTVVSFGTSAPEMFVSALATYRGEPEIALGNVIGSNIANIALVLALTAIVFPIIVKKDSVKLDAPFMLLCSGLLFVLMLDLEISRLDGVIFLLLLAAYSIFIVVKSRKSFEDEVDEESGDVTTWLALVMVLLSAGGLAFGSHLLVGSAKNIAEGLNISERLVSITVIAFGTSLPELTTSLIAAIKKEMDISIGNIIGSNIFNILAVFGVSSLVKPLAVDRKFIEVDIYWMLAISVLLFLFILPLKGGKLTRVKGGALFLIYLIYMYFIIMQ